MDKPYCVHYTKLPPCHFIIICNKSRIGDPAPQRAVIKTLHYRGLSSRPCTIEDSHQDPERQRTVIKTLNSRRLPSRSCTTEDYHQDPALHRTVSKTLHYRGLSSRPCTTEGYHQDPALQRAIIKTLHYRGLPYRLDMKELQRVHRNTVAKRIPTANEYRHM